MIDSKNFNVTEIVSQLGIEALFSQQVKQEPKKAGAAPGIFTWWGITGKMCFSVIVACEQAFGRAWWGEGKSLPRFPFPFLAICPQTESLFTGYSY